MGEAARREVFHGEMTAIGDDLIEMTRLVGVAIENATTALLDSDAELAADVIDRDRAVDDLREHIEVRIMALLSRQQPVVATDLRVLVASLRMNTDLERMGDLALHVAKLTVLRHPRPVVPTELVATVQEMAAVAAAAAAAAGAVIATRNLTAAVEMEHRDDDMDDLHSKMFALVLYPFWPHGIEAAVDLTLLSRYYERFADHAVSIARRVRFLVDGIRPDHDAPAGA